MIWTDTSQNRYTSNKLVYEEVLNIMCCYGITHLKLQRDSTTHQLNWLKSKNLTVLNTSMKSEIRPPLFLLGMKNGTATLWKTACQHFTKLNIVLAYDLVIVHPFAKLISKRMTKQKSAQKCFKKLHHHQTLETIKMSFNRWINYGISLQWNIIQW